MTASPRAESFPFPFPHETYRYSANVEPGRRVAQTAGGAWGSRVIDVDDEYAVELAERRDVLRADPSRYSGFPHMMPAQWDAMLWIMKDLATSDPDRFALSQSAGSWTWQNRVLDTTTTFVDGDLSSLPADPLEFIGRQIQEDLVLLDQREGALHIDATFVTFSSSWSPTFVTGMTFREMHGPVPRAMADGMLERAEAFTMRLQPNEAYRRQSWGMQVGRRLDISLDAFPEWMPAKLAYLENPGGDFGERVHLRVEVQHLVRLPATGVILFTIHTYLLAVAELLEVDGWAERTISVLDELPEDLATYKGLTVIGPLTADWLRERLPHPAPKGTE